MMESEDKWIRWRVTEPEPEYLRVAVDPRPGRPRRRRPSTRRPDVVMPDLLADLLLPRRFW